MADKKKYYKLDDTGIVGTQSKKSAAAKKYHAIKTSAFFRNLKVEKLVEKELKKVK